MKKIFALLILVGLSFLVFLKLDTQSMKKSTVVILLGPPGTGKGTQAVRLAKELNLPHISTGDLFRENMRNNTPLGIKAKEFIDKGHLVSDELVIDMLFDRISKKDCENGYILDGFPRTLSQAEALNKRLGTKVKPLIVNLEIDDSLLVERITGRLMCKACQTPYHKSFAPPKVDNICDKCQSELYQRKDDTAEVVKERLVVYHKDTAPLLDFYKNQGIISIDSTQSIDKVFEDLLSSVNNAKGKKA